MKPAHFIFPILALILGILCAPRDGGAPGKPLLETNPPGAAAERESRISRVLSALLEPDYLKQRHALFSSIETLRAADLGEMVARADSLPTRYRKEVLGVVVDRWFELDPVAAAAWVRPRTAEDEAWKVWARQFPKAVIEELHGTSSFEYDAVGILHEAVNALAGGDPADQLRLLSSLPADATRDRLIHQLLVEWVSRDASAAFFFAKDSATGAVAFETRQAIFELWVNRHPLEAAKELHSILPDLKASRDGTRIIAMLTHVMVGKGIDQAFEWVRQLPVGFQESSLKVVAQQWAATDPIAALQWCLENGIDAARAPSPLYLGFVPARTIVGQAMQTDATRTLQWIASLPTGSSRDALLERVLHDYRQLIEDTFPKQKGDALVHWISQLPPGSRKRVTYHVAREKAVMVSMETMHLWSRRLPAGPLRAAAIEAAARVHFQRTMTPRRQAEILKLFPDPREHDAALLGIVSEQDSFFPAQAASNIPAISDPLLRRGRFDRLIPGWLEREPEKARAWLNQTPAIPPEWKAQWLKEK